MKKKILISLLAACVLFNFVVPPKKSHAIAPVLAWGLWTVGGIVADVAIEQGIKWVSKTAAKKSTDKVTKQVLDNADDFDFTKEAPKKTKTGELSVPVSTLDKQKIAKLWKDEGMEVIEAQTTRKVNKPTYDLDVPDTDPLAWTSLSLDFIGDGEATDFVKSLYDITFTPVPYEGKTKVTMTSAVDGSPISTAGTYWVFNGGSRNAPAQIDMKWTVNDSSNARVFLAETDTQGFVDLNGNKWNGANLVDRTSTTYKFWLEYKRALALANRTIYVASGMVVPDNVKYIYDIPLNAPSGYDTGNALKPSSGFTVKLPDQYNDGEEYELTETNYHEFETIYNDYVKNDIENRYDLSETNYDYSQTVINNYYTYDEDDGDKPIKDVSDEITIIIENNNNNNGGTPSVPVEDENGFFTVVGEAAAKVSDMYDGTLLFLEKSVDNLKKMMAGFMGLIAFNDEFFDWLPDDTVLLLNTMIMLGVVAFFFRR